MPTQPCTVTPEITELVPALNSTLFDGVTPLPTTVQDGRGQVVTYNPVMWAGLRFAVMPAVTVKGTGQPDTKITLFQVSSGGGTDVDCTTTVSASGTWACEVPFSAFPMSKVVWRADNVRTGVLSDGRDGSWQVIGVRSSCGLGSEVRIGSGYTTPIAIDFSGSGRVETVSAAQAPAPFAFGAGGQTVRSGWLAPTAGFLVWDRDGDGRITSIEELFGGGVGDGFAKLAQLDADGDGVVDARDSGYSQLSVWRDRNMNKVTDPGELMSLAEAGVVSLSLAHDDYWEPDATGNAVYEHGFATLTGGQRAAMNDVYFAVAD